MAARGSNETIKRKELVGKLNPTCLKAFSEAAQAAKRRGNPYVELIHITRRYRRIGYGVADGCGRGGPAYFRR